MRFVLLAAAQVVVPPQHFYRAANGRRGSAGGCARTDWPGTDPRGMAGYPWLTHVACGREGWSLAGVAGGPLQLFAAGGRVAVNGAEATLGGSFWASEGAQVRVRVAAHSSLWVVGSEFRLDAPRYVVPSSWSAPTWRTYFLEDAKAGDGGALHDDAHICNGTSPSRDFTFTPRWGVDPALAVVLNCAGPKRNFVWSHFHPSGAVYLPLAGSVCFSTDAVACVQPGEARWTSPLLQYYELFEPPQGPVSPGVARVRELAGRNATDCERPLLFAVTNFDASSPAGVPNFGDWPLEAHSQVDATSTGPWGLFREPLLVRGTTSVVTSVVAAPRGSLVV